MKIAFRHLFWFPTLLLAAWINILPGFSRALHGAEKHIIQNDHSVVTLEVRDADLRATLMELAGKAKINLLISPKVRGTLTCRVTDMDPFELLIFIARANGLEFEDHGRIKVIMADEPVDQGNVTFEIIPLQNAKAEEVARMIESLRLDKNTHVVHDAHGNRLIVTHRNAGSLPIQTR